MSTPTRTMPTSDSLLLSPPVAHRSRVRESWLLSTLVRLARNPQGVIGLTGLTVLVVAAVFAGPISGHDPIAQDAGRRFLPPSLEHPFGTDELRRDLFARALFGLRTSLGVAVLGVGIGAVIGIGVGMVAGYAGGWTETLIMRVVDTMLAFPALLGAMAIVTILGPGARSVGIAIAVFGSPAFMRLARAQVLTEKHRDYVLAARAVGVPPVRIVFRHIALNAVPPLLTQVALGMAVAVLVEAALSFLGLGQRPPAPSLSGLINASKTYLRTAWWYAFCPGAVLALLLLSLNLLADAINEATSPYARRRM